MNYLGATCSALPIQASDKAFRIIPAGSFKAVDGRPVGGAWFLTAKRGAAIVEAANQRKGDYVIDYEHQTLECSKNGKAAPAAGWFHKLQWRDDGLYITDARWTAQAKQMIDAKEYRYVSPVFEFNPKTFEVLGLQNLALTNNPALHGLTDLAALKHGFQSSSTRHFEELTEKDRSVMRAFFGDNIFDVAEAALREEERGESEFTTSKDLESLQAAFGNLGLRF